MIKPQSLIKNTRRNSKKHINRLQDNAIKKRSKIRYRNTRNRKKHNGKIHGNLTHTPDRENEKVTTPPNCAAR